MKEKIFAYFNAQDTETQGITVADFLKGTMSFAVAIKSKMEAG